MQETIVNLKSVRRRAIEILEAIVKHDGATFHYLMFDRVGQMDTASFFKAGMSTPVLSEMALHLLEEVGALWSRPSIDGYGTQFRATYRAEAALERLKAPRKVWLKENYFPVGSLIIVGLIGIATIVSNFVS